MLTNIGILASGKGMVLVPNLSGLSKTAAATAITNAGLIPINGGSTNTENSALNNTIASQLPNAGELVPYESQVTYIWFNFVAAPPFFPPTVCNPPDGYTYGEWSYSNVISTGDCIVLPEDPDPTAGLRLVTYGTRTRTGTKAGCSNDTQTENGTYEIFENCTETPAPVTPPVDPPVDPPACSPPSGSFIYREIYTEPSGDCYIDYCVGPAPDCGEVQCGGGCF